MSFTIVALQFIIIPIIALYYFKVTLLKFFEKIHVDRQDKGDRYTKEMQNTVLS